LIRIFAETLHQIGDATVAVPLDFMRVPLITLVGWWLYGERPDAFVFLGVLESHSVCCGILHAEATRKAGSAK
jgi:uncharacterized membrane protein